MSQKAKRLVKSVPAAEIFAAAEGFDEGKTTSKAYGESINVDIKLRLSVDPKDFLLPFRHRRTLSASIFVDK